MGVRAAAYDNPSKPTKLVVGLFCSEIYEFTGFNSSTGKFSQYKRLMAAHYAPCLTYTNEVWGLDIMQSDEDGFVTCSDDQTLRRYSISQRQQTAVIELNKNKQGGKETPIPLDIKYKEPADCTKARSVGVHPNGKWAVVGTNDGTMHRVGLK